MYKTEAELGKTCPLSDSDLWETEIANSSSAYVHRLQTVFKISYFNILWYPVPSIGSNVTFDCQRRGKLYSQDRDTVVCGYLAVFQDLAFDTAFLVGSRGLHRTNCVSAPPEHHLTSNV